MPKTSYQIDSDIMSLAVTLQQLRIMRKLAALQQASFCLTEHPQYEDTLKRIEALESQVRTEYAFLLAGPCS